MHPGQRAVTAGQVIPKRAGPTNIVPASVTANVNLGVVRKPVVKGKRPGSGAGDATQLLKVLEPRPPGPCPNLPCPALGVSDAG